MTRNGAGREARPAIAMRSRLLSTTTALALGIAAPAPVHAQSFVAAVVDFVPGTGAGYGQDRLPDIVLGPPRGGGPIEGSADVLSLGNGGRIVLEFAPPICDGPGADFTIFENAFAIGDEFGPIFAEVGIVEVSRDNLDYTMFPYDAEDFSGLAGITPVFAHPGNNLDPLDPNESGGDPFDLADLGIDRVRFVRITDPGAAIADPGNRIPPGTSGGFDLDAIAVLHECSSAAATPTATGTATATATHTAADPQRTATPTQMVPTATPSATPEEAGLPGDADANDIVDRADLALAVLEIYDGDGSARSDVAYGTVATSPDVDANGDGRVTAADLVAIVGALAEVRR